jgi:hypothetical protein
MAEKSLCFLEAFREMEKGRIDEEEYFRQLFAHCKGVTHEEDEKMGVDIEHVEADPFGYSVRCWAVDMDPVQGKFVVKGKKEALLIFADTTPFENVFKAYRTGDATKVQELLSHLNDQHARLIRKSLSMLALQERRADVLKLCLDQGGFPYEHYFEDEANEVKESEDPETFKVLEESKFRILYPRKNTNAGEREEDEAYMSDQREELTEEQLRMRAAITFDAGGEFPVDW